MARRPTWVVKLSKLCNLRCRYCYEYNDLGDSTKVPPERFGDLFERILAISTAFDAKPKYCWHGGEPLLLKPAYYEALFESQRRAHARAQVAIRNIMQTNLTILSPELVALLSRNEVCIGVSLDLFGGLRIDRKGVDSQAKVLENMDLLRHYGIEFGCITVLNANNADYVDHIFDFFNMARLHFRVLPFYRFAIPAQVSDFALTHEQIVSLYIRLFDRWFADSNGITIKPIHDYFSVAMRRLFPQRKNIRLYDKRKFETVYVVDVNGDLYSVADTYNPAFRHGNLYEDGVETIVESEGRRRAVFETEARIRDICQRCRYYGSCTGYFVGEATPLERRKWNSRSTCGIARPVIRHVERRLERVVPDLARGLARRCGRVSDSYGLKEDRGCGRRGGK